jgi:hypothetical protein
MSSDCRFPVNSTYFWHFILVLSRAPVVCGVTRLLLFHLVAGLGCLESPEGENYRDRTCPRQERRLKDGKVKFWVQNGPSGRMEAISGRIGLGFLMILWKEDHPDG